MGSGACIWVRALSEPEMHPVKISWVGTTELSRTLGPPHWPSTAPHPRPPCLQDAFQLDFTDFRQPTLGGGVITPLL